MILLFSNLPVLFYIQESLDTHCKPFFFLRSWSIGTYPALGHHSLSSSVSQRITSEPDVLYQSLYRFGICWGCIVMVGRRCLILDKHVFFSRKSDVQKGCSSNDSWLSPTSYFSVVLWWSLCRSDTDNYFAEGWPWWAYQTIYIFPALESAALKNTLGAGYSWLLRFDELK